jgi:hypothetical protein
MYIHTAKIIRYKDGSFCNILSNGTKFWHNDKSEHHRIDGPSIEWNDGSKDWVLNNRLVYIENTQ